MLDGVVADVFETGLGAWTSAFLCIGAIGIAFPFGYRHGLPFRTKYEARACAGLGEAGVRRCGQRRRKIGRF